MNVMNDESLVMIFEKPSLYFFPYYRDRIYAPFCSQHKGMWYLVYKALYLAGSPLCSVFWGKWKQKVKKARMAVIFDYGYQKGMETFIKKINPACEVYLFCWNKIDKAHCNYKNFRFPDHIFSTDMEDCRTFGFKYNHMFYPKVRRQPVEESRRLFFVGADKGRMDYLSTIGRLMENCDVECDIRVLKDKKGKKNFSETGVTVIEKPVKYSEYLKELKKSGILLEIVQKGQRAITMRTLEAIFFSKKLITNNTDIVKYDFYCENNILVLPESLSDVTCGDICSFLEKPFLPYSEKVKEAYGFEHWKNGFLQVDSYSWEEVL